MERMESKTNYWFYFIINYAIFKGINAMMLPILLGLIFKIQTYTSYTAGYSFGLLALKECEKNSVFNGVVTRCSVHYKLGLSSLLIQPGIYHLFHVRHY